MRLCRCLLLSFSLMAVVGCVSRQSSAPSSPQGAEFRTGNLIEPGYAQQIGYSTRWLRRLSMSEGQSIFAAKPIDGLLVCVERPENVITALDLSDGSLVWKLVIGDPTEDLSAPVGNDDFIFVYAGRRVFKIDRRRGAVDEVQDLAYTATTKPLLVDDLLILGSATGQVFGHDVNNGFRRWAYGLPEPIYAAPVEVGDNLFAADIQGNYVMLRLSDGELRWSGHTYGPVTAEPAVDRQHIVLASEDQSLYSLLGTTGRQQWLPYRSEVPLTETPTVVNGIIYLVEPNVGLSAINGDDAKQIWQSETVRVPLLEQDGTLLAHTDRELARLDLDSGRPEITVPTRQLETVVTGVGQSLILVSPQGELIRLDPQ